MSPIIRAPYPEDIRDWYLAVDNNNMARFFQEHTSTTTAAGIGDRVGTWVGEPNASGVTRSLNAIATNNVRPTLATDAVSGKTVVSFAATASNRLRHNVGSTVTTSPMSVVLKLRITTVDASSRRFVDIALGTATSLQVHRSGSQSEVYGQINNSSTGSVNTGNIQNATDIVTLFYTYNAGAALLRWCVGSTFSTSPFTNTGAPTMNSWDSISVGGSAASANYAHINVEAMRVYQRALSEAEQRIVFSKLLN